MAFNKTVATKHLINVNFNEKITECIIPLPEFIEILSVQNPTQKNSIPITFIAPTNMFDSRFWRNYHFFIIKSVCSEFDFDAYKYIGTISKDDDTFVIYLKKGLILSSS